MSALTSYVEKSVIVITTDGRCFVGTLKGYDQATNLILSNTKERIILPDEPTEVIDLGLYLIRGETVAICGLIEQDIEAQINWEKVRGKKIQTTKHAT